MAALDQLQLISLSAAEAATKYSRLIEAARFQHSALSYWTDTASMGLISAVSEAKTSLHPAKKSRIENLYILPLSS
jgi:hypothetical protein